jgi:hypothetical protein
VCAGARSLYTPVSPRLFPIGHLPRSRIGSHREAFHASFDEAMEQSPAKGSPEGDQAKRSAKDFEQATELLRDRVNDRQSVAADAENVLMRATAVDTLMMREALATPAQRDWRALRLDMDELTRAYGIASDWRATAPNAPARVDDTAVREMLKQIGVKADRFGKSLDRAFDRSTNDERRGKSEIRQSVKDFERATDRLRDRIKGRQSNTVDVEEVLRRGDNIDAFMQRNQLSNQAEQNWLSSRDDLDGLARAYNVGWNWTSPTGIDWNRTR